MANTDPFRVIIVGAGIGGLVAAIECLRHGMNVTVLEKAAEISPIGAGIQIPPNAARVLQHLGLEDEIRANGAVQVNGIQLKRWQDGSVLCTKPGGQKMIDHFGAPWFVIHRGDYHRVLLTEARRLGLDLRLDSEVVDAQFEPPRPHVVLQTGEKLEGDVIVGADGLWSSIRDKVIGKPSPPEPTGDLAYRGTFTRQQLEAFNDPEVNKLINSGYTFNWLGPGGHSVFYPVKNGSVFNLVLTRPDDLPSDSRTSAGDIGEMRDTYKGWDPAVQKIISCQDTVLKWKLCHHDELPTWVSGNAVTIGDASHPSLPYQAQGAAMAAEDGVILGLLLGRLQNSPTIPENGKKDRIHAILELFENLRKKRTTLIVQGAIFNRHMHHMEDGPEQQARDRELAEVDWVKPCKWQWADIGYQKKVLGFQSITETERAFDEWARQQADGQLQAAP